MDFHSTLQISDEQVASFKVLYEKHAGHAISVEEAQMRGQRLVDLVNIVLDATGCELE